MSITYKNEVTYIDATIANGASLSSAVDLGEFRLCAIAMPAAWTAADLTFQASYDGTTYNNVYKSDAVGASAEYQVDADTSRHILVCLEDFAAIQYLKVRSGTAGSAVNQGAARTIYLIARRI